MKNKLKLFGLAMGGFLVSILPLMVVVVSHWSEYTKSVPATVKLCTGGLIAAVLLLLKVLGQLKLPSGTVTVVIVLVLSELLKPILVDLSILCVAYLIGDIANALFFRTKIKRLRESMKMEKQANVVVDQMQQAFSQYIGNGRV